MRLGARVLAGIAAAVLAAACGGDTNDAADGGVDDGGVAAETGATGAEVSTSEANQGAGAFYPTGPTGSTGPTGPTGADVEVSLNNYLFDPDPVRVTSGDLVALRNANTKTPHTFTVVGQDVDVELGPLETETIRITLDQGTYELICRFHQELDMTGSLVVT